MKELNNLRMEDQEIIFGGFANSSVLNNYGGPTIRVRTENISSSIFADQGLKLQNEKHSIKVPENVDDIENWLLDMAHKAGWNDLEEAIPDLELPEDRLLAIPFGPLPETNTGSPKIILRSALILSRCNQNYYTPDAPMIFTKNRLNRNIELMKINLNGYYGMD